LRYERKEKRNQRMKKNTHDLRRGLRGLSARRKSYWATEMITWGGARGMKMGRARSLAKKSKRSSHGEGGGVRRGSKRNKRWETVLREGRWGYRNLKKGLQTDIE